MYYAYNDFRTDINKIVDEINYVGAKYDYVVGIVRGGAIPAVCLSHQLNIPMKCVSWSTYHQDQMKESAQDIAEDIRDGKKVLVVDDILDSGKTIAELIEDWAVDRNTFDIAAMIWNTAQGVTPNYHGRTINRDDNTDWVTFWWETRGE